MTAIVCQGDARALQLPDESVDLIVTSPPYFNLRKYAPGEGERVPIGEEDTPSAFIASLIECTREMARVLKPSGSIFVNLGDSYSGHKRTGVPPKSLLMLPERYRIAAVDELGLVARAVIVWSKPNGLPESVTDRVRRSHEDWVHLTKSPRYYSAVDEIREPHAPAGLARRAYGYAAGHEGGTNGASNGPLRTGGLRPANPLGKLPGSVWSVATQPLKVPAELGVDHYAAYPMEWPRRLITGWCPREVCTACGEGRRPVADRVTSLTQATNNTDYRATTRTGSGGADRGRARVSISVTGYACACPDTTAPATPGVVLDPFGGTGTTALVADVLGRVGISVDASADYGRVAVWRTTDEKQRTRAGQAKPSKDLPLVGPEPEPLDPVLSAIAAASSGAELRAVHVEHLAVWSEEYTTALVARVNELAAVQETVA